MSTVDIAGLTFGFDNQTLFRDFCLASFADRILIRGPSGCGKTTLLKIIDGVLKTSSTIARPEPTFLVLQSDGLVPWLTGKENIKLFSERLWSEVVKSSLFPIIEPFINRVAHKLSFGQRRSIELVRALVSGRPLLLLDEPLNFLDRARRDVFLEFMRDRARCPSRIVLTSHYEDNTIFPALDIFEFEGDPPYTHLRRIGATP